LTTSAGPTDDNIDSKPRGSDAPWNDRLYLFLLGFSVVGILIQITLGGVVRVTGSGDGCPDWPQCFGRWIPPWEYHAILEYSHRSTGTVIGIIMLLALIRTVQKYRSDRTLVYILASAFVLVGIVGIIGGQVVLNDLNPAIRTLHLGLAEIVLLLMIIAFVVAATSPFNRAFKVAQSLDARQVRNIATWAAIIALVALLSGAYAVWRNAGGVCDSWPLCGGPIIPEISLTFIHMVHRLLAGISVILAAYAAHRVHRLEGASKLLRLAAAIVLFVIIAQVFIGAANPWTDFETWVKASHLSMATVMFAATSLVAVIIWVAIYREEHKALANQFEWSSNIR
jgi:heme A synthase